MINYFNLPYKCKINQRLELEEFIKHAPIDNKQKLTVKANTLELKILYNITPDKSGKISKRINNTDYSEIQIFLIRVHAYRFCKYEFSNFARLFFRSIPYPLVLIVDYQGEHNHYVRFASSNFHEGKIDISKNVQDSIVTSGWIDLKNRCNDDVKLFETIKKIYENDDNLHGIYFGWTNAFANHYCGDEGNWQLNRNESIYRKEEMRQYFNTMEIVRKSFEYERK